ncbi:elongation factor Ts [Flavimobilis marinus]|uniref:Elongation factor Ts n=1 Tax=Flavimobilis marinus TaxID=285351 RepID=A0A1I2E515_9MICO|nr:translation elongation factor Ts [Flavimobilis marinus]GHG43682.1 elongation factor Ts [Flavimobilis marinus]SFE87611.1 elongation factor Ts [Flavimobilis marinus]
MANYTAADIKALRERTGAGMLDVKKALDEADGNAEKALEIIRVKGLKGVSKREGRATSEGLVALQIVPSAEGETGTVIELNCETDFVAKNDKFIALSEQVLAAVVAAGATEVDAAQSAPVDGQTVAELIVEKSAELGEKIALRRVAVVSGEKVTSYLHRTAKDLPPSIGVLVATDAAGAAAGKDVAQHVAAIAPTFLSRDDVPAETVENERRIAEETSRNEGKPEAALPKIVEGRLGGFFKDVVLLDQPLAKDPKKTVKQAVAEAGGVVTSFVRFRVGS